MVIVIISLLIGLLLPAINGAVIRAREARVMTDIQGLAGAIADFKAQFGFEPPSRLVLYEDPNGWANTDAATSASRAILRQMFPQAQLNDLDGNGTPNQPSDRFDFNHDGQFAGPNEPIVLNGAECLVFFLGGIQVRENPSDPESGVQMIGFAKNPRNPFSRTGNRLGPFYSTLNAGRLSDINGNRMMELLDPLPGQSNPYWYISSNGGQGYNTPAVNNGQPTADLLGSGMFDVYRQSPPDASATPPRPGTPHNPQSYQIISPGYDGAYGTGGYYDPNNADGSLLVAPLGFSGARVADDERDNITNFHLSRLSP